MVKTVWAAVVALVVIWLLSLIVFKVSSALIHLLLLVAVVLLVYNLVVGARGRRQRPL